MIGDAILFTAEIIKVQTMSDFGIRITLDLPQDAIETASKLMECRRRGALLEIAALAIDPKKANDFSFDMTGGAPELVTEVTH